MSAVANFTTRYGFCSILGENTAFCVYLVHMKYCVLQIRIWRILLTTTLECQKQLLMSSISNLGGRESREIAVIPIFKFYNKTIKFKNYKAGATNCQIILFLRV